MVRCRVHVFPPETDEVPCDDATTARRCEELEEKFSKFFTNAGVDHTQEYTSEWVSEVFDDTDENLERVSAFKEAALEIYPDGDVLETRQKREAIADGADAAYEAAIFLNVTYSISS